LRRGLRHARQTIEQVKHHSVIVMQLSLLDYTPPLPTINFKGATYDAERDFFRLNNLLRNVRDVMLDQGWLSLAEIQSRLLKLTGKRYGEGSIRARTADFRNHEALKDLFVSESKCASGGLWLYRLTRRAP